MSLWGCASQPRRRACSSARQPSSILMLPIVVSSQAEEAVLSPQGLDDVVGLGPGVQDQVRAQQEPGARGRRLVVVGRAYYDAGILTGLIDHILQFVAEVIDGAENGWVHV